MEKTYLMERLMLTPEELDAQIQMKISSMKGLIDEEAALILIAKDNEITPSVPEPDVFEEVDDEIIMGEPEIIPVTALVEHKRTVPQLQSTRKDILCFNSFQGALTAAEFIASSNLVPPAYRSKPADIILAWQFGAEVGLAPMQSLTSIAVINGKPGLFGDSLLAVAQSHPDWAGMTEMDPVDIAKKGYATCIVHRHGCPDIKYTFTKAMAQKAHLIGKRGPWIDYEERMMMFRARNFALRGQYADILSGFRSAEELRDYPEENK